MQAHPHSKRIELKNGQIRRRTLSTCFGKEASEVRAFRATLTPETDGGCALMVAAYLDAARYRAASRLRRLERGLRALRRPFLRSTRPGYHFARLKEFLNGKLTDIPEAMRRLIALSIGFTKLANFATWEIVCSDKRFTVP